MLQLLVQIQSTLYTLVYILGLWHRLEGGGNITMDNYIKL